MPRDPILAALDDSQRGAPSIPPMRTVPPTAAADPPDYYRGLTFALPQIERLAGELGVSYDEARTGVIERGGRVLDEVSSQAPSSRPQRPSPEASMPGEAPRAACSLRAPQMPR